MRLLLDAGFPESTHLHGDHAVQLVGSHDAPTGTDVQFVFRAATQGFDGVVFLGREALARGQTLRAAVEHGVSVAVTHADEPIDAAEALGRHLHRIAADVGPNRAVLILSGEVRAWALDELARDSGFAID